MAIPLVLFLNTSYRMVYQCPVCTSEPNSHSFKPNTPHNGVAVYYTRPAEASKYDDVHGIVAHYDGVLSDNQHGTKNRWMWILDCNGFEVKHMREVGVAIALAKLITSKYATTLIKIIVANPTWHVRVIINVVWPFLSQKVRDCIYVAS